MGKENIMWGAKEISYPHILCVPKGKCHVRRQGNIILILIKDLRLCGPKITKIAFQLISLERNIASCPYVFLSWRDYSCFCCSCFMFQITNGTNRKLIMGPEQTYVMWIIYKIQSTSIWMSRLIDMRDSWQAIANIFAKIRIRIPYLLALRIRISSKSNK